MHLINIKTLELEEFIEGSIPEYAILSHRWTKEELTFKEVFKKRPDTSKKGFSKLVRACQIAKEYDVEYLWIDACCIDKRSSAELSEAINSMFAWYEGSEVCIAYLEDVSSPEQLEKTFKASVWFTRSWTLQELLAPDVVEFYDGEWRHVGDKESLADIIMEVTNIKSLVLSKTVGLSSCSVAEKMSWAVDRTATRTEDIAYSLMGLFEVNMALLYGEGWKAFQRLQEEIIRRTDDLTILLWGEYYEATCLLARSPEDYRDVRGKSMTKCRPKHFDLINRTLEIETQLMRFGLHTYYFMIADGLDCSYALKIRQHPSIDSFYRECVYKIPLPLSFVWAESRKFTVLLDNDEKLYDEDEIDRMHERCSGFAVFIDKIFEPRAEDSESGVVREIQRTELEDPPLSDPDAICFEVLFPVATYVEVARFEYRFSETRFLSIYLTFDFDWRPCAVICNESGALLEFYVREFFKQQEYPLEPLGEQNLYRIPRKLFIKAGALLFRGDPKELETYAVLGNLSADAFDVGIKFDQPRLWSRPWLWMFEMWVFDYNEASRVLESRTLLECTSNPQTPRISAILD